MLIVHVTSTDPAGSIINFTNAINRHTKHTARSITVIPNRFGFPGDLDYIADAGEEVEALLVKADVIHLHKIREEDAIIPIRMQKTGVNKEYCVKDFLEVGGRKKKIVYHVHGHPYERENPQENGTAYFEKGNPILASTPDLVEMYKPFVPQIQFFPNCVPIHDAKYLPRATDEMILCQDGVRRYVVFQAPTNTVLKNTAILEEAHSRLKDTLPVILVIVTNSAQAQMLTIKRSAHIIFDHMQGYYGVASLEGLSMGKPTIAGLSDITIAAICDFFKIQHFELPWQRPRTVNQLQLAISDLLTNEPFRIDLGKKSRKFMQEVWSDKIIGEKLAAFYESL